MTKSTITRERLEVLANAQYCKSNPGVWLLGLKEVNELARMALAALDSEPDRNPVLAYADSYRDMAKQGVESVPIWSVITDLERNIAPLYRHAQQPVVPASQKEPISFDEWSRKCALQITLCYPDFREKAKYIWDSARETQQPALVVPDAYVRDERGRMMLNGVCEPKIGFGAGWNACRAAMLNHSGDATEKGAVIGIDLASGPDCSVEVRYVAPPGYVMVPKEPTAEMIWAAKYCFTSTPGWDVFKSAYIAMLAAAPQEVKGE
ncbi:hypothetical protein ACR2V3_04790 [Klebsiella pneumoniae]